MKIICAWCQAIIRDDTDGEAELSHGICDECFRKQIESMTQEAGEHGEERKPC